MRTRITMIAAWVLILGIDAFERITSISADYRKFEIAIPTSDVVIWEVSSHIGVVLLLPLIYWLVRRFPFTAGQWRRSIPVHAIATIPFSLFHVGIMVALRKVVYLSMGRIYDFGASWDVLLYEYRKDLKDYIVILAVVLAMRALADRWGPVLENIGRRDRLAIKVAGKTILIPMSEITSLEASGNYVRVRAGGRQLETRETLKSMLRHLDPTRFVQVHRSYVVNAGCITEVVPQGSGDSLLRLKDGSEIRASRRSRSQLEAAIEALAGGDHSTGSE